MKKFLSMMAIAAMFCAACACSDDDDDEDDSSVSYAAPTITWESNPDFEQQTITSSMDIVIEVSAPSGIASFLFDIDSNVLSSVLTTYGLATSYDLVTDDLTTLNAIMQLMGGSALPYGSDVEGATDVTIDISALVPLIANMGASSGSEHNFTITVTDVNELSSTATLSFVIG